MSAYGIHPTFTDLAGYRSWLKVWRRINGRIARDLKDLHRRMRRPGLDWEGHLEGLGGLAAAQAEAASKRVMASKLMGARESARLRWQRILAMQAQVAAQDASLPLDLGRCAVVDFHYNKGHTEFPEILPMWTLKVKGRQLFLAHIDFSNVTFSTRELFEGPTKGMLRLRNVHLAVDRDGIARIAPFVASGSPVEAGSPV